MQQQKTIDVPLDLQQQTSIDVSLDLQQQTRRVLDGVLDVAQELHGRGTVHQTMVVL
jgi:hypothetical protein